MADIYASIPSPPVPSFPSTKLKADDDIYRRLEDYESLEGLKTPFYPYQHVSLLRQPRMRYGADGGIRDPWRRCYRWRLGPIDSSIRSLLLFKKLGGRELTMLTWLLGIYSSIQDGMTFLEGEYCELLRRISWEELTRQQM